MDPMNVAAAVDGFLEDALLEADPALEEALAAAARSGLPHYHLSPSHAKMLHLLARLIGATRILEIGTLAGYSGIWLARALPPDGRLVTIEVDERHAAVARASFAAAGVAGQVDLRVGAAVDVLPAVESDRLGPFDMVFIDADKANNELYLEWAVRLARPGCLIVLDNVIRRGAVIDSTDPDAAGARDALRWMGEHPDIDAAAVQTVGSKGYDGFAIAVVGRR